MLLLALAGCQKPKPAWTPAPRATAEPVATSTPLAAPRARSGGSFGGPKRGAASSVETQMLLGLPDRASTDPANTEHYLLARPEFALSYNNALRFPNWVAWHLSAGDIGDTERGNFTPDPDLPDGFTRITTSEYNRSGYDRGHNCPSKDRSARREINDVAFFMTNITPQQHGMNAGPWERLESYCRQLAQNGSECYILCGHGFRKQDVKRIGRSGIAVPDFGWKIVVVLPDAEGDDRARIGAQTRVIAVMMPNISTISRERWDRFLTTPAEIERATGLTFFRDLPDDIAGALRYQRDAGAAEGSFGSGGAEGSGYRRRTRSRGPGSFGG
jgi:endonuclease G